MLSKNKVNVVELPRKIDGKDRLAVVANDNGKTSWRIRKFPQDVRNLAEDTARKHDMKLADFLAEAIVRHAAYLDSETETLAADEAEFSRMFQEYAARIEALENRLGPAKGDTAVDLPATKLKARIRVANMVERPWLKNR